MGSIGLKKSLLCDLEELSYDLEGDLISESGGIGSSSEQNL